MTVHMIRAWSEPPDNDDNLQQIRETCEDWVSRYDETLESQRLTIQHIIPDPEENKDEHTTGYWRFVWAEDHTQLLDDLETDLQDVVSWYRLRYHECANDEDADETRPSCEWDDTETRDYGTVPSWVP